MVRRPGQESLTSPRRIRAVDKQRQAIELRLAGRNYTEIAETLGYKNHSCAGAAIRAGLKKTLEQPAQELRELTFARLTAIIRTWWPSMVDVGQPSATRLKATECIRHAIQDMRALMGLDLQQPVPGFPGSSPDSPLYTADVSNMQMTLEEAEIVLRIINSHREAIEGEVASIE